MGGIRGDMNRQDAKDGERKTRENREIHFGQKCFGKLMFLEI
jgi:hypothetical protein